MSYLDLTRLNFRGYFQADVSTVNNLVTNYDVCTFDAHEQDLTRGNWNPVGTGAFRLIDCSITGGILNGVPVTKHDTALSVLVENTDLRVSGKLVDLDPQQQAVSEIWGMSVRLALGGKHSVLSGEYETAAFINLWGRQQDNSAPNDQKLAAVYHSLLRNIRWLGHGESPLLKALQEQSKHGCLSINMNVFGYGRDPSSPRYTMGHVVGSIGPWHEGEPHHFVVGRQMIAVPKGGDPTSPTGGVYNFTCKVHQEQKIISADLGNSLPVLNANSGLMDIGDLTLAVAKISNPGVLTSVTSDQFEIIGTVAATTYTAQDWFAETAAIVDFSYGSNDWIVNNIGAQPLLLLGTPAGGNWPVLLQESLGGVYVRADNFVSRLDPGQSTDIDLYASSYGQPLAGAAISIAANNDMIGGAAPAGKQAPEVGIPADGISYAATLNTDHHGKAVLKIQSGPLGPGTPRGYIGGQMYGIGYNLTAQPANYVSNAWDFISVLAFSPSTIPEAPTWEADIKPIFTQYGNLYPIMSKHLVDLSSYESVCRHLEILRLAFSLPIADPNHMPVTRDLSADDLKMILKWMGPRGSSTLPLRGQPQALCPQVPQALAPEVDLGLEPMQERGKTSVLLNIAANRQASQAKRSQP